MDSGLELVLGHSRTPAAVQCDGFGTSRMQTDARVACKSKV